MKYQFSPSAKAFPESKILRTIDVDVSLNGFADGAIMVDGQALSASVIAHAAAFGLKQRLANSYVSASTATDDKTKKLLPQNKREALWQGLFDKMLGKIKAGESPDWSAVFSEGGSTVDPFTKEVNTVTAAKLRAWAKAKNEKTEGGYKLPKVDSDEYKSLHAKMLAAKRTEIEATARERLAELEAIGDVDLDLDGAEETESVPE